jgi:hypothetical protein
MEEGAFRPTTAMEKLFEMKKRIRNVRESTGAGKTVGITIWDVDFAQSQDNQIIDVVPKVSLPLPHKEASLV